MVTAPLNAEPLQGAAQPDVAIFTDEPCTEFLHAIDRDPPKPPAENGLPSYVDALTAYVSQRSAALGFIFGYDAARGGLSRDGQSTLERLRDACDSNPGTSAKLLLDDLEQ